MTGHALQVEETSFEPIKCVVWDLDDTLWDGALLEGGGTHLKPGALRVVRELDRRGVLQSVASRNDLAHAREALERAGLWMYFLHPQIHWEPKSKSLARIAEALSLSLTSFLFVDDQAFEREEVKFHHTSVEVVDALDVPALLTRPRLSPRFLTSESSSRREMYQADLRRKEAAVTGGLRERDFLETLGMVLHLRIAGEHDLERAEELTARTHQLNTTGYTYSHGELLSLLASPTHDLLVAQLEDRFGTYGTIGLLLLERVGSRRTIKLFITSCRVMNRGVAGALLHWLATATTQAGLRLCAEFIPTDRNRVMYVTYRFAGFVEAEQRPGAAVLLEHPLDEIAPLPGHIDLRVDAATRGRLGVP